MPRLDLSSETLATFVDHISDAVTVLDHEWRFTYANDASCRIARLSCEALLGSRIWDLYPDVESELRPPLERAMRDREATRAIITYDPFGVTVEITAYPIEDGILVVTRQLATTPRGDASGPEAAEGIGVALAEWSGQLYRTLATAIPQIIWVTDPEGRTLYLNERWYEYSGASLGETDGMPSSAIHPDDQAAVLDRWTHSLKTGEPFEAEMRIRSAAGEYRWFLVRAISGRGADGEVRHWVGTSTDIEEQKQAEARFRHSESLLKQVIESMPIGLWILDESGNILQANSVAREIWGERIPEQEDYRKVRTWRVPSGEPISPAEWPATRALRNGEAVFDEELDLEPVGGTRKRLMVTAIPIRRQGKIAGAVVVIRDVTETRRIERESERLSRRVEQSDRIESLGRVAATMAHEINNILMSIQPMADLLERSSEDPRILRAAEQIARNMQRGRRVTEEILRFTRPAGPVLQVIDLRELVTRAASEAAAISREEIDYRLKLPGKPLPVRGDAQQLEQVMMNILFNARDAMPEGGRIGISAGTLSGDHELPLPPGRWTYVAIRDTGHGIAPEVLGRIFEPFFTTREQSGTGLGLAVVHQIVAAHGGLIHATSRPGQGSTFWICLPPVEGERAEDAAPAESSRSAPVGGRDILMVEDEADVAEGLQMLLELEGQTVRVARTAAEGLKMLEERKPDVVVLDVGLPDMEGTELFERMRAVAPELPIIFSTGHGDAGRLARHRSEPHVRSLLKPYSIEELLAAIAEASL